MSFHLSSSDNAFNARVSKLFESLASVSTELTEKECKKSDEQDDVFKRPFLKRSRSPVCQNYSGHKRRCIPDYVKNPDKWKCYSLKETKCLDDNENRIIASQLFSSLKPSTIANLEDAKTESFSEVESKPPTSATSCLQEEKLISEGKKCNNNFVLPQYDFCQKRKMVKRNIKDKSGKPESKSNEVSLSHLMEEVLDED